VKAAHGAFRIAVRSGVSAFVRAFGLGFLPGRVLVLVSKARHPRNLSIADPWIGHAAFHPFAAALAALPV